MRDYTKLKSFRTTQQRKQSTELNGNFWNGRKIFADLMSDKGLIFKLYKKSFNSIATTTKN